MRSVAEPAAGAFTELRYEVADGVATITLDRPGKRNAFTGTMADELVRAAEAADADDGVRVVLVTGAGRAFCVGADLKSWGAELLDNPREYWKWFGAFKDMHDRLREIGKPTVARVNGIAVGGGNELQMACAWRVAGARAELGQPEINLHLIPGFGGTQ